MNEICHETVELPSGITRLFCPKSYFICGVCGDWKDTEREALKCQRQKPQKIRLMRVLEGKRVEVRDWRVGDMVILDEHDADSSLALIMGCYAMKHDIVPIYRDLIHEPKIRHDSWNHRVLVLDDKVKTRILDWAEIIKATQEAAGEEE